jgi:polysaccharide export outer membrane protein
MRFPRLLQVSTTVVALGMAINSSYAQEHASPDSGRTQMLNSNHAVAENAADLSVGKGARAADPLSQYAIGSADVIRINVWKNTDLSQTLTVDPDGFVSVPLLGDVHVAGMTTNQLAGFLASKLKSFVVSPQVTVSVVDIRSRQVYVMGQVGKAGSYPLITPITVLQLIAQAGGLNTFAKRKDIYVLRAKNGTTEKLPFNYVRVTHGDAKENIVLQPGDTVIVP